MVLEGERLSTLHTKEKVMKISRYGLPAIVLSLATAASADPFYDSLTVGITAGISEMKTGVGPILAGIVGLTLLFTGVGLVIGMVKSRKPKVV